MALTLLILVIAIFKYIKTSKIIWIYVSVAFLSLGYTIKESMYIYSFLIFLVVYISMFTTFMIAPQGLVTGQWQSLGYWLAQHEVARGSQPYYYYLLILFTNEFLPFLFGIPLSVYYLIKGEFLSKFVSFWAMFSLISFSIAGEKMPWLTVNLTLPFIFVFSIFSRDVIKYLKDRSYQVLLFQFISAFIVLILTLKILFTNYQLNENLYYDILYLLTSLIIIAGINLYLKNIFSVKSFSYSLLSVIAILSFFLTIRTTNIVVFLSLIHI